MTTQAGRFQTPANAMNRLLRIYHVWPGIIAVAGVLLLATPLAAGAQPARKVYRIGVLETVSPALNAANFDGFRQGLSNLGYVEGRNLIIEYRSADSREERFPGLASELVRLKIDLIFTRGTPATRAAANAAGTVPVVEIGGDLVGARLIASLARPGGNVTGLTTVTTELDVKRLDLLREMVPRVSRIAVLGSLGNPRTRLGWKQIENASRSLGAQLQFLDVRKPDDIGPAFDAAVQQHADALIVEAGSITQANRRAIADLAIKHRLPAIYPYREYVDAGGLMSYGADMPDMYRRAADYVDRIFKGATPADLAVQQATKFELIINAHTARALGVTIPPSFLLRADHVIE